VNLPTPPKKKDALPSMLDKNREIEDAQVSSEALTLPDLPEVRTGKFTVSPVTLSTLDGFEAVYQQLRKQRRTLKRYQVAEALMAALAEEPSVLTEVIKRLR